MADPTFYWQQYPALIEGDHRLHALDPTTMLTWCGSGAVPLPKDIASGREHCAACEQEIRSR